MGCHLAVRSCSQGAARDTPLGCIVAGTDSGADSCMPAGCIAEMGAAVIAAHNSVGCRSAVGRSGVGTAVAALDMPLRTRYSGATGSLPGTHPAAAAPAHRLAAAAHTQAGQDTAAAHTARGSRRLRRSAPAADTVRTGPGTAAGSAGAAAGMTRPGGKTLPRALAMRPRSPASRLKSEVSRKPHQAAGCYRLRPPPSALR